MGRPAGSRNKPKTVTVDESFMPVRGGIEMTVKPGEPEPEPQTLAAFASSVLSDEKYRESLRIRAQSGRLTASESKLLIQLGLTEAAKPKPKTGLDRWLACATSAEIQTLARVIVRSLGRPYSDDPVKAFVRPDGSTGWK